MINLSGHWAGSYAYPGSLSPVPFEAELRDDAGRISGVCSEAADGADVLPLPTHSSLSGHHDGQNIVFTKIYDSHDQCLDPIGYRGCLDADGCEISGTWTIVGGWSGPFVMTRPRPLRAQTEASVGETV